MASLSPARASLPRLHTDLPRTRRPGTARRPHRATGAATDVLWSSPPGHLARQNPQPLARLLRPDDKSRRFARPPALGRRAVRTRRRGTAGAVASFTRGAG